MSEKDVTEKVAAAPEQNPSEGKKKKKGCLVPILIFIILILLVVILFSCGSSDSDSSTEATQATTVEEKTVAETQATVAETQSTTVAETQTTETQATEAQARVGWNNVSIPTYSGEKEEDYKNACQEISCKELLRNPEKYIGTKIKFRDSIYDISRHDDGLDVIDFVQYEDTMFMIEAVDCRADTSLKLLEADDVMLYGDYLGINEGITGEEYPMVAARYIDLCEGVDYLLSEYVIPKFDNSDENTFKTSCEYLDFLDYQDFIDNPDSHYGQCLNIGGQISNVGDTWNSITWMDNDGVNHVIQFTDLRENKDRMFKEGENIYLYGQFLGSYKGITSDDMLVVARYIDWNE